MHSRRRFLGTLGRAAGVVVVAPVLSRCVGASEGARGQVGAGAEPLLGSALPGQRPLGWDPLEFNRKRGAAGAIPAAYMADINGVDGDAKHLGKHLPYVVSGALAHGHERFLPLMWGDPGKGHARHPNAAPSAANPEGHWYNWIRLRVATDGPAEEVESVYSRWPVVGAQDSGQLVAATGADPAADQGRNTVYLARLPQQWRPGATLRVHAHCLTHGEYVDFVEVPAPDAKK